MSDRADIDRVREASDLAALVAELTPTKLRTTGRSTMALCPFHEEKTPSFSIDRSRGLFNCFGCLTNGDVFDFIQKVKGYDFREALEFLAARGGITLSDDGPDTAIRQRAVAAKEALRLAVQYWNDTLYGGEAGGPGRALIRGVGLTGADVREFKLGYATATWDEMTKALRAAGVAEQALIDAGVTGRGRHGLYDVVRGRVIFPVSDFRGDPIGFISQKAGPATEITSQRRLAFQTSGPSILGTPERMIFGLTDARTAISRSKSALIYPTPIEALQARRLESRENAVAVTPKVTDGHLDALSKVAPEGVLIAPLEEIGFRSLETVSQLERPFREDFALRVASAATPETHQSALDTAFEEIAKHSDPVVASEMAATLLARINTTSGIAEMIFEDAFSQRRATSSGSAVFRL